MGIFDFGKKNHEKEQQMKPQQQQLAAEEAERQRKAAEEAERQRKAAEEAERQRKAAEEAERQRKAAEEAERQRKAAEEAERQRKAAEEAECQRKEEEERRKLMTIYDNFASRTSVDCNVFASAGFKCDFNDMKYAAQITPSNQYLDCSYKKYDGTYNKDRNGSKKLDIMFYPGISFDLIMIYNGNKCILFPRFIIIWPIDISNNAIKEIYIKIGENRYSASLININVHTELNNIYGRKFEVAHSILPLGSSDIAILREIVARKYSAKIVLGDYQWRWELSDLDIAEIKNYLDVCERAGVFSQAELAEEPNKFSVITKFNP